MSVEPILYDMWRQLAPHLKTEFSDHDLAKQKIRAVVDRKFKSASEAMNALEAARYSLVEQLKSDPDGLKAANRENSQVLEQIKQKIAALFDQASKEEEVSEEQSAAQPSAEELRLQESEDKELKEIEQAIARQLERKATIMAQRKRREEAGEKQGIKRRNEEISGEAPELPKKPKAKVQKASKVEHSDLMQQLKTLEKTLGIEQDHLTLLQDAEEMMDEEERMTAIAKATKTVDDLEQTIASLRKDLLT